ncbi:hypothetical protein SAMD00019534_046900 [Acytostelium subglobosum LB1]|uniref:hypothetical protein n=1 Tax=Acytostelium subglobosum LB1 TaxID=1410327 RepID=UPI0006448183|nr:hypothetical protein SAMD00019534_046900 [Acytostelium subglobosum LB1]GAM21515.1 hypothetical protein SAMD00019534_046900 [Acytostelium subglobosum LB1]|eukprot:XP_012755634.1 hypothetical protein SAMD00019534_046900 [Acytostelium subglobosum LB1]
MADVIGNEESSSSQLLFPWIPTRVEQLQNNLEDDDLSALPTRYVLEENVSLERFLSYEKGNPKVKLQYDNGTVYITQLYPSVIHDRIAPWIMVYMIQNRMDHLMSEQGRMMDVAPGIRYMADNCIIPTGRPDPVAGGLLASNPGNHPFPIIIIEVGVHSSSLDLLHQRAVNYLGATTDIQFVICIKLFSRYPNQNHLGGPVNALGVPPATTFCALAFLYRRAAGLAPIRPTHVVSFGARPLVHGPTITFFTGLGVPQASILGYKHPIAANPYFAPPAPVLGVLPPAVPAQYLLQLPIAEVFNGVPGGVPVIHPPGLLGPDDPGLPNPATIDVDLCTLRKMIEATPNFHY